MPNAAKFFLSRLLLCFSLIALLNAPRSVAGTVQLERQGGVYVVPVIINSQITLKFIVDSGAAVVVIPDDVFSTLLRTGTISKSDIIGKAEYSMANGDKTEGLRFHIRSLQIGSIVLRNVEGSTTPVAGDLLLGQAFLGRLQTWTVDNVLHQLVLNEPSSEVARTETSSGNYAKRGDSTDALPPKPYLGDDLSVACGAAKNICRDGPSPTCDGYKRDLTAVGYVCNGVND